MSQSFFQKHLPQAPPEEDSQSVSTTKRTKDVSCLETPFVTLGSFDITVSDLIIITSCIFIMIGCAALFVLSATQTGKNTKTKYIYLDVYGSNDDPCDAGDFYNHRPFKFRVDPDTEYLYCPWPESNTATRMCLAFVAFFVPLFWIIGKAKSKRWPLWTFCGIAITCSVAFFLVMCVDANDVRRSKSWCEDGLEGVITTFNTDDVVCDYENYIVICLIDAALFIAWAVCFIFALKLMMVTRAQQYFQQV